MMFALASWTQREDAYGSDWNHRGESDEVDILARGREAGTEPLPFLDYPSHEGRDSSLAR